MKVNVNDVHPESTYNRLTQAMEEAIRQVQAIPNPTPVLDRCQICKSRNITNHATISGFDMFRCADCGLIFCNPYPSIEQLHFCYNADWTLIENALFRETFDHRVNIFMPRLDQIRRFKKNGKLLDIGSSIGVFLEALTRCGMPFETTCCELNTRSCVELRERFPAVKVINSDFMALSGTERFDVVTLWDTIEHIVDLNAMLAQMKHLLASDGVLIFSTPNTESFEWRIAGTKHGQLAPPTHVNLFNPKAVKILLESNGFELIDLVTANASLDISSVKRMIENGTVEVERIGAFLKEELFKPEFEQVFERYLVDSRQAGNVVAIARLRG